MHVEGKTKTINIQGKTIDIQGKTMYVQGKTMHIRRKQCVFKEKQWVFKERQCVFNEKQSNIVKNDEIQRKIILFEKGKYLNIECLCLVCGLKIEISRHK